MNFHFKTKIYYFKRAFLNLKNYKRLGFFIITFSLISSLFEGFSIGALIPFLESLMNDSMGSVLPSLIPASLETYLASLPKETTLSLLLVFMLLMVIFKNIFLYLNNITVQKTSSLIKRDLQNNFFRAVTDAGFRYHHTVRSGELVNSVLSYAKSVVSFSFTLLQLTPKTSRLLVYLLILFIISWKLTLIALVFEIILFPIVRIILNKVKNINIGIIREMDNLSVSFFEILNSLPLIKISGTEEEEKKKFSAITTNLATLEYKEIKYQKLTPLITEIIVLSGIIAIFLIAIRLNPASIISLLPLIIAYLYVFLRLFQEINSLLTAISGMFQQIPAFKTYEDRLNKALNSKEEGGSEIINSLTKGLEFKNVSFSYSSGRPIIKELNLFIPKGSFVALVGASGSGKTTISNLISGLLLPDQGEILIDDINLKDLDLKNWRRHIGYIPQEPIIFNQSLAYNIAYGHPNATTADIVRAATIADLHNFILTLPEQYDTPLGERGVKFSGGQKQRLAIARAIIRDPELLILDEATSSLDSKTEKTVQKSLEKAMAGRTVIAVAHRLSTIRKADKIAVLENGQIAEVGSHEELINQNGLYRKLYEIQFKN